MTYVGALDYTVAVWPLGGAVDWVTNFGHVGASWLCDQSPVKILDTKS